MMPHNPLGAALGALGCAWAGVAMAQHPQTAIIAPWANYEATNPAPERWLTLQEAKICTNAAKTYPAEHLILEAPDGLPIDCNLHSPAPARHILFQSIWDRTWYAHHQGKGT